MKKNVRFTCKPQEMDISQKTNWEIAATEYDIALKQFRHFSTLRRQDMLFVTTVQGVTLTIIGKNLLCMKATHIVLSCIAFAVILLGINSERRLSAYMDANAQRARIIEGQHGMSLLSGAHANIQSRKCMFSNTTVFKAFYSMLLIAWFVIWILNVV